MRLDLSGRIVFRGPRLGPKGAVSSNDVVQAKAGTFADGTVFEGKYRLDRLLGRGGMGEVYAGTHTMLDKPVAVKVLLAEFAHDAEMVGRMTREARAASSTGHPHIALVTDMGWTGDRPFLVMELLEGETLDERIRRGRVPIPDALAWTDQILDALEAVHAKGLVHRDLKPANLMVVPRSDGALIIKVLDFGISKRVEGTDGETEHTKAGALVGTPRAMAPEQAMARPDIDARADIHAVGSVLYTMLCGDAPFRGPTITATLARVLDGGFTPASSREPSVPPALDAVIAKALSVDRTHRYSSARAMRLALADVRTRLDQGLAFTSAGPPSVDCDVDLPRERTLPTPAARPVAVERPTITSVAEPAETQPVRALEPALELDVPDGWRPGQSAPVAAAARRAPPSNGVNWGWWITVAAVVAAGVGTWMNWDALTGAVEGAAGSSARGTETVLLLVDTVPKNAIVFVDDVQRDDRPLEVLRTDEPLKVRVVAQGYAPRVIQVVPTATRRLEVKLDRRE